MMILNKRRSKSSGSISWIQEATSLKDPCFAVTVGNIANMVVRSRSKSCYSHSRDEEERFLLSPLASAYIYIKHKPLRTITRKHARSISLPSQSHPFMPQFDEHLSKVKASEATTSTLSSMINRLHDLSKLYDSTEDVLALPHIQQAISQECQGKLADELLDGYLRLLDACSTARDLFSQTKQSIQDILSALRRKHRGDLSGYLTFRRKSQKMIQKTLKGFRCIKSRQPVIATEKDTETLAVLCMLKEVEAITLAIFESMLSHLNGKKQQTCWSRVSKLMNTRAVNQEEEINVNEFDKFDATLHFLTSQKQSDKDDLEQVQNRLGSVLSSIQTVEDELDCLFKHLIKSRVFLLNILNH